MTNYELRMRKLYRISVVFAVLVTVAALDGCTVRLGGFQMGYSFTGANIPAAAQTFSVGYFRNDAAFVAPALSNMLTESLKDRLTRQTRLSQVSEGGDLAFEGEITDDATAPAAIGAGGGGQDEGAVLNRITITVQVRFTNIYDSQWDFSKSFSAYADYDANQMRQDVEAGLLEEIVTTLVDNIFNASVANW